MKKKKNTKGINHRILSRWAKEKNTSSPEKLRKKYGLLSSLAGIISNVFLSGGKVIFGIITGSISLIADGLNNLSDAASSMITYLGFHLASRPADKKHPYGHQRIEYLTGLFVAMLMLVLGAFLLKESIEKAINPTSLKTGWPVYLFLGLSLFIKWWQCSFYKAAYEKTDSVTLKAASVDSRNDLFATGAVLLGLLVNDFWSWQLDGYLGMGVSIFILWSAISLIYETSSPLLGEAPNPDLVHQLLQLAKSDPSILGVHDLVVHNYGPEKLFVSLHLEFDHRTDLLLCHHIVENIEQKIAHHLGVHCVIHIDPIVQNDPHIKKLAPLLKEKIASMEGLREFHDLRVVPGKEKIAVIVDVVVSPSCSLSQETIHKELEEKIREHNPRYVLSINFDEEYVPL